MSCAEINAKEFVLTPEESRSCIVECVAQNLIKQGVKFDFLKGQKLGFEHSEAGLELLQIIWIPKVEALVQPSELAVSYAFRPSKSKKVS